jgi:Bacteriophage head to tail connecting protein
MNEYRDYILDEHYLMKEVRAIEEPIWREIAAFLRPDDRDFDAHVQRRRDDNQIFDISPILDMEDFEGGFFSQATNPMNRWLELSSGDEDLDKYQPVKAWLWRKSNLILASFAPGISAFYAEVPDWYGHIGCFGCSPFYTAEDVGHGRFVDMAIPINESYIKRDANGRIDTMHREFNLTGQQAKKKFPGRPALADIRDRDRYVFVHAVWPNPEYIPGRKGPLGMPFAAGYASPDLRDFYVGDGYYEFPYGIPSWKRRSGRPYPTGIGHLIRADVVMLNEIERSTIAGIQFAAEPPFLAHEKSEVRTSDIEPNAVLYGTINSEGKELFGTLERGQNMPETAAYSQQKRDLISRGVRFGLRQLLQRPQMTATEFLGFQEEDLKLFAPGLVRVQNEGLSSIVARRFAMLDRAGPLHFWKGVPDPPPPELVGRSLQIRYVSPLAKMLKVSEAKGAMQWVSALMPYAQVDPSILDNVDKDNYAIVVHDGFTSDPSLLTDPKKRDAARAQRASMQQQAAKLQLADQAANVRATVAHARQAETLSAQRT